MIFCSKTSNKAKVFMLWKDQAILNLNISCAVQLVRLGRRLYPFTALSISMGPNELGKQRHVENEQLFKSSSFSKAQVGFKWD